MKKLLLLQLLFVLLISFIHINAQDKYPTIKHQVWGQFLYNADQTEGTDNSFSINRLRLGAKGNVLPDIGYAFLFEAAGSPKLLQAWIDYSLNNFVNIRIGQYKYPFGKESYVSATTWKFINPSFITNNFSKKLGRSGASFRDMGVQLSGKFNLSEDFQFVYKAMYLNGNGINTKDDNSSKDIVLHGDLITPLGLDLGLSFYNGSFYDVNLTEDYSESAIGVDLQWNGKVFGNNLRLQGEYITVTYETAGSDITPNGYYAYLIYNLLAKLEAGIRYDSYNHNSDAAVELIDSRTTLSLGYYFGAKQRINLNYELVNMDSNPNKKDIVSIQFQTAIQ